MSTGLENYFTGIIFSRWSVYTFLHVKNDKTYNNILYLKPIFINVNDVI